MSLHTCVIVAKLVHFFEKCFGSPRPTLSSLDASVPSAGPPPTVQPPPGPSHSPARSPHTPSLGISYPQASTISASQVPSSAISPSASLQPPKHSFDHGMLPSGLAASRPGYDTLHQPPPVQSHSPALTPLSPQPSDSRAPPPQVGEPGSFAGAHDFKFYNPRFNDFATHNTFVSNGFSLTGSGLKELLKHSMPDTFHDSAARYPPPKCHLGTRKEYIAKVVNWAFGGSDHNEPILWMRGPFGVGKSAVAQSCAEALQLQNKLIATLFFSRSNADRDDPRLVFTSIVYQIAAIYEPFSNIVDARIRKDPAITTKSLSVQFKELLVRPFSQVNITASGIDGCVVIIDGLDECRGSPEQCEIIEVIATSVRERTTPFRWFITSRPEDSIVRTMKSPAVSRVSLHLELPVSREIDHEILLYLTDEFKGIRERHGLADSWPPEEVTSLLVERAAGLWIHTTTIVRFIKDENSYGPEDQLQLVVQFLENMSTKVGLDNPFAEMDFLYTLIMQRIPEKIRKTAREILLIYSTTNWPPSNITPAATIAAVAGLSEKQFRHSCISIQSVLELRGSNLESTYFHFYHTSFLDFIKDPARSKNLCIHGDFLIERRRERLHWVHQVCSRSTGPLDIQFPVEPVLLGGWDRSNYYTANLYDLLRLCGIPNHPLNLETAASLEKLQFGMMLRLTNGGYGIERATALCIRINLSPELCDKIIRLDECPVPGCTNPEKVWIWGHGENEIVAKDLTGDIHLVNNQDPRPGWCLCGSQIKKEGNSRTQGLGPLPSVED